MHGGPGSGARPGPPNGFDLERYRVVNFDQRGLDQHPHASDPAADMSVNTAEHLLSDLEQLRTHLGIERWLLLGRVGLDADPRVRRAAPGAHLGDHHPAVTTTRHIETDWLYRGVGRFFPGADRFRDGVPEAERDGDLVAAYSRLMENPDPDVRARAANDWLTWEDAVISAEPNGTLNAYTDRPDNARLAFVRICAHYFSHDAWLEEGVLLREAGRLAGIPGVLVHGRLDMGSPLSTAWELTKAWPDAPLIVVEDSGHTGSETFQPRATGSARRIRQAVTAIGR